MVEIRRLGPDDWQLRRTVRLAALSEAPYAFGSTYEREVAMTEEEWRARRSATFVGLDETGPVGIAGAYTPPDEPDVREVVGMWVQPAQRGGKLADQLLAAVLDEARADGVAAVRLWVTNSNARATGFYRRHGFRPTGRHMPLRPGATVHADEYRLGLSRPG
jgi:ribosomal protein S18 acetylase RimI-like enzyme